MEEKRPDIEKWALAAVRFYNIMYDADIGSVYDIPANKMELITIYTYKELYKPFVYQQLSKGLSTCAIARQTGLSPYEVRNIGIRCKLLR